MKAGIYQKLNSIAIFFFSYVIKNMNIEKVNFNNTSSFGSIRKRTYDNIGNVINCNYTNFNREDIDWIKLAHYLDKRFANNKKINVFFYGCSDGSDVYTFIINLINQLKSKAEKFFPVQASDLSPDIINQAKQGLIQLHEKDIDYLIKNNALDYFKKSKDKPNTIIDNLTFCSYIVSNNLKKLVNFQIKDVRVDSRLQDYSNAIFIFRNGWTFNSLNEQDCIAHNVFKNSNNTLVIIGQSDLYKSGASDFLQKNGFKGIESDIFTRAETNYPSKSIGQPKGPALFKQFILFEKR